MEIFTVARTAESILFHFALFFTLFRKASQCVLHTLIHHIIETFWREARKEQRRNYTI